MHPSPSSFWSDFTCSVGKQTWRRAGWGVVVSDHMPIRERPCDACPWPQKVRRWFHTTEPVGLLALAAKRAAVGVWCLGLEWPLWVQREGGSHTLWLRGALRPFSSHRGRCQGSFIPHDSLSLSHMWGALVCAQCSIVQIRMDLGATCVEQGSGYVQVISERDAR